jgi:hypothetical protein
MNDRDLPPDVIVCVLSPGLTVPGQVDPPPELLALIPVVEPAWLDPELPAVADPEVVDPEPPPEVEVDPGCELVVPDAFEPEVLELAPVDPVLAAVSVPAPDDVPDGSLLPCDPHPGASANTDATTTEVATTLRRREPMAPISLSNTRRF